MKKGQKYEKEQWSQKENKKTKGQISLNWKGPLRIHPET